MIGCLQTRFLVVTMNSYTCTPCKFINVQIPLFGFHNVQFGFFEYLALFQIINFRFLGLNKPGHFRDQGISVLFQILSSLSIYKLD